MELLKELKPKQEKWTYKFVVTNNITMIVKVTNQKIRQSPEPTTQNNLQYVTQWQPVEHLFTNSCLNLPKKENLRDILNLS